ncbi:hybrid signal transduction histidine kinase A [Condylostylus longicornis]|uniref:hybrid signal transduction histidine kinase A n=1 Tax=Condylostylus longicornis TaxID=2530218 RepID=UPI00244E313D|nr:hybrid signal transduction histidine kinase A [Condylostylus longicornis]
MIPPSPIIKSQPQQQQQQQSSQTNIQEAKSITIISKNLQRSNSLTIPNNTNVIADTNRLLIISSDKRSAEKLCSINSKGLSNNSIGINQSQKSQQHSQQPQNFNKKLQQLQQYHQQRISNVNYMNNLMTSNCGRNPHQHQPHHHLQNHHQYQQQQQQQQHNFHQSHHLNNPTNFQNGQPNFIPPPTINLFPPQITNQSNFLNYAQRVSYQQQPQSQQQQQQNILSSPLSNQHFHHQNQPPPLQPPSSHPHNHINSSTVSNSANGWAGIPLISNSSAIRRPRKISTNSYNTNNNSAPTAVSNKNVLNGISSQQNSGHQIQKNNQHKFLITNSTSEYDENAMSKLAIHAHGVPLILAGRYKHSRNNYSKNNANSRNTPSSNNNTRSDTTIKNDNENHNCNLSEVDKANKKRDDKNYKNDKNQVELIKNDSVECVQKLSISNVENSSYNDCNEKISSSSSLSSSSSDSVSVNSDECNTQSNSNNTKNNNLQDTCLPRIIKPRKRRKKDRKMPGNVYVSNDQTSSSLPSSSSVNNGSQTNVNNNGNLYNDSSKNIENKHLKSFSITRTPSVKTEIINKNYKLINQCNQTMKIPNSTPKHDFKSTSSTSSITSSSVSSLSSSSQGIGNGTTPSTTLCFCRQCDPSCRIWAFPLRRSCSDNSADIQRTKNVGVIGSGSTRNNSANRSSWNSDNKIMSTSLSTASSSRNGSFSDSIDSSNEDSLSGCQSHDSIILNANFLFSDTTTTLSNNQINNIFNNSNNITLLDNLDCNNDNS